MPFSTGFNHVATLTTDMDKTVRFYEEAFDAKVLAEIPLTEDHPWMKVVDVGGGAALNIFEVRAEEMIGERRRQGHRGAVDHFAFAVDSRATLEAMRDRLAAAGAQEVGEVQQLGSTLSVFFRDLTEWSSRCATRAASQRRASRRQISALGADSARWPLAHAPEAPSCTQSASRDERGAL